jgi:uncharacterized RDD family membrane protein YckC
MRNKAAAPQQERIDPLLLRANRETAWQQEIRERMRLRRNKKLAAGGADLPLFNGLSLVEEPRLDGAEDEALAAPDLPLYVPVPEPAVAVGTPVVEEPDDTPVPTRVWPIRPTGAVTTGRADGDQVSTADVRAAIDAIDPAEFDRTDPLSGMDTVAAFSLAPGIEPETDPETSELPTGPVERHARWIERVSAGLVDAGIVASMIAVVAYFTSRMAPVGIEMGASGPWFVGFALLLTFFYAGYFTGTNGQTPGKMIQGLRVVDESGQAPGFVRALGRSALGAAGVALCGAGVVPAAFDPAGRSFHDRIFRTRVVRQ